MDKLSSLVRIFSSVAQEFEHGLIKSQRSLPSGLPHHFFLYPHPHSVFPYTSTQAYTALNADF